MIIELTNAATCTSLVNAITFYAGACLWTSRACAFLLVHQPGASAANLSVRADEIPLPGRLLGFLVPGTRTFVA